MFVLGEYYARICWGERQCKKYFVNESIELNKTFEIESGDQHHIEK